MSRASITPVRALVAAQLVAIVVVGLVTAFNFSHFTGDEGAHYSYVQHVAQDGAIPVLPRALISPEAEAIYEQRYPAAGLLDPARRGLGGRSYEAFQPPLYYGVAALPFLAGGGDHLVKLRFLRLLGVAFLLLAAWLMWRLVQRVARKPEHALGLYALALSFLLWPGTVLRVVTIGNAGLELVLGVALSLLLWDAWEHREPRRIVLVAAVFGLGLLTRLTLLAFAPSLVVVAVLVARQAYDSNARRVAFLAASAAIPALMLVPWIAFNLHTYDAPTAWARVKEMQEHVLNPRGYQFGLADLPSRFRVLARLIVPEEYWVEFLSRGKRLAADAVALVLLIVPFAGALRLPAARRAPLLVVLALPVAGGLALMTFWLLIGNWDFFLPRYLYPELAGFAVLGAVGLRHLTGSDRVVAWTAAAFSLALVGLWVHLHGVTPFTG